MVVELLLIFYYYILYNNIIYNNKKYRQSIFSLKRKSENRKWHSWHAARMALCLGSLG